MTPPVASVAGASAGAAVRPPAVSVCLEILAKRADFLRAARAERYVTPGFILQARRRKADEPTAPDVVRVGFTCSKKVGNAVARNRAKRRLRELARLEMPTCALPGWDYVLIGRQDITANRDFAEMRADLCRALRKLGSRA